MIELNTDDQNAIRAILDQLDETEYGPLSEQMKDILAGAGMEFEEDIVIPDPIQCTEYLDHDHTAECCICRNTVRDEPDLYWVRLLPDGSLDPGINGHETPVPPNAELGWWIVGPACQAKIPPGTLKIKRSAL